ncbi:MAG: hypothetical protein AMJ54_10775 [Deltaproteobacteria bacterium SG8_13]|nr:MAG: hypothetical protein AMJ54_10775 [Deltaproteobacteria bacterium SG8_13]
MVIAPKEKPVVENLNSYYLDIGKLLEHYQGEVGSGSIFFRSTAAQGVIFFDHDDIINGCIQDREEKIIGEEAVTRLMNQESGHNFLVDIYHIPPQDVYFWSSMPSAEIVYDDLSTEFTDLKGLLGKLTTEKLTGFINVTIGDGSEQGLVFISNGEIVGGSFSWKEGKSGSVKGNVEKLVEKTKAAGGLFQVSRIPLAEKDRVPDDVPKAAPSSGVVKMLEEFMGIFESLYTSKKTRDADCNSVIRKKFVEMADRYAFLDPFAAEFEYADRQIRFTGEAGDEELAIAVISSVQELAQELGIERQFKQHLASWTGKYKKPLEKYGIRP